jgi:hypothetical protein
MENRSNREDFTTVLKVFSAEKLREISRTVRVHKKLDRSEIDSAIDLRIALAERLEWLEDRAPRPELVISMR